MNFIKQIAKLKRQQKEIEKGEENLEHKLTYDGWGFCLHLHCVEVKISAWKKGTTGKCALLVVKQDGVEMLEAGSYTDSWREAEKILNERLLQKFKGIMSIAERITELGKLDRMLTKEIEATQNSLNSESKWLFCIHVLHCAEPRISAWKRGDNSEICASFAVEEGKIKILTTGMYGPRCYEAQSILINWSTPEFSGEE